MNILRGLARDTLKKGAISRAISYALKILPISPLNGRFCQPKSHKTAKNGT